MPICPICDDSGVISTDSVQPRFCYCAAGKQARRQWENQNTQRVRGVLPEAASFIDVSELDQVNANVDAMRASLFGSGTTEAPSSPKHPAIQLLQRVGRVGHEITVAEAAQLQDLRQALEGFLGDLSEVGRKKR
ncbi:hypothetical protein [Dictyobacter arantiisoli]|uniref:Uncharacterized protein n=1 Tax=Dictyobacter arantiisoli TaxID=2014874 RepID=A0A5A5TDX4_9CHLR|nr:hypothetical protein [Dictyobacter arantiisoli]GCF09199.1 hypothetical protein KDI_27630 [Dictyobacter arantiisoli]